MRPGVCEGAAVEFGTSWLCMAESEKQNKNYIPMIFRSQ